MLIAGRSRGASSDDQGWELGEPKPVISIRPGVVEGASKLSCAECHAEVVSEWANSAHGLAWVDEAYRTEIVDRERPERCHACHIPSPLLVAGPPQRPQPRGEALDHGIDCNACHLGPDGVLLGARGEGTPAHPTQRSEHLSDAGANALCAACHSVNVGPVIGIAKDFETSRQASRGRSCVGCHLAVVERNSADGGPARRVRSHALQTPRDPSFLRRAFALSLEREGAGLRVVVTNRAGHRVPGLIGREIQIDAEVLDEAGTVLERGTLKIDTRKYLAVDGKLEIPLARAGAAVRVVGLHRDPRAEQALSFLEERLVPEGR